MNILTKPAFLALIVVCFSAHADQRFSESSEFYSSTQDWQKIDTPSTLSQFVYQDHNVNGVYDLDDIEAF